jgi:hypothetical protein
MKKILPTLTALSVTLFLGFFVIHTTHAQADYTPLAPLPGTYTGSEAAPTTNISTYLGGAIKLLIALGAGLAVLMAVIGGTQYVAAGISPDAKSGAKDRLMNAFIGLALVLTSYLILNSINPDLVNFKLELPPVGTTTVVTPPPGGGGGTPGGGGSPGGGGTPGAGWGDDATWRSQLQAGGVQVKTPVCTTPGTGTNSQDGQHNCTSVYQLPSSAISGTISLKNACNCAVVITQGTEYWLHKTHGTPTSRVPVVDLRYQESLNSFITNGRTPANPQSGCGIRSADHYSISGATYVLENPGTSNVHWHVCY